MYMGIKRQFAEMIFLEKKVFEFRKFSSCYVTGDYQLLDSDVMEKEGVTVTRDHRYVVDSEGHRVMDISNFLLGACHLKLLFLNPKIFTYGVGHYVKNGWDYDNFLIDKDTYNFIRDNYINKHDFIAYDVTEPMKFGVSW